MQGDVLGRIKTPGEDYVYGLVNATTACGTVGEATATLFRGLGYKSMLVIVSNVPPPLQANHILAEIFLAEAKQWVMIDSMINYVGTESVFQLLNKPQKAAEISARHAYDETIYDARSVVWLDRRGLLRNIYYYTPLEKKLRRRERGNRENGLGRRFDQFNNEAQRRQQENHPGACKGHGRGGGAERNRADVAQSVYFTVQVRSRVGHMIEDVLTRI